MAAAYFAFGVTSAGRLPGGFRVVPLLWLSLLLLACTGCAVDDKGLVGTSVRYLRNDDDTARAVVVDTWGLHVVTHSLDGGLTLGPSHKAYFYPGGRSRGADGADAPPVGF